MLLDAGARRRASTSVCEELQARFCSCTRVGVRSGHVPEFTSFFPVGSESLPPSSYVSQHAAAVPFVRPQQS